MLLALDKTILICLQKWMAGGKGEKIKGFWSDKNNCLLSFCSIMLRSQKQVWGMEWLNRS